MKYDRKTQLPQRFFFGRLAAGLFLAWPALTLAAPGGGTFCWERGRPRPQLAQSASRAIRVPKVMRTRTSAFPTLPGSLLKPYDNPAPGDLDPTFGNGGKVATEFHFAHPTDVVVQADGKIVVCGTDESNTAEFVLVRYHADGSLDTSFGNGGKVSTGLGQPFNYANGMAIQADGKIVVTGYAGAHGPIRDFAIVRYETNGSLDTSFDGDGKVIIDMGGDNFANDLAIQTDGKIVVVGGSGPSYSSRNAAFALA